MTATKTTKPAKDGTATAYTQGMATESVGADLTQFIYLAEPAGEALIDPRLVTTFTSGAITNPTSVMTRPLNTIAYAANQFIGSNTTAGSVVVPSFAIVTTAGGAIFPRLRLRTNATSGWGGVSLSINLWSAAPTYTNGDGGAYAVATGSAGWIANVQMSLIQFGDGAAGAGPITGANEMALKLASGTSVFWDIQMGTASSATPISGQTFTITAELLN
jgi:hypothetical protein